VQKPGVKGHQKPKLHISLAAAVTSTQTHTHTHTHSPTQRHLLASPDYSSNLGWAQQFTVLQDALRQRLRNLGLELKSLYLRQQLRRIVGSYNPGSICARSRRGV